MENPKFVCKGFFSELHCAVHFAHVHQTTEEYNALKDAGDRVVPMLKMDDAHYEKFRSQGKLEELAFTTNCRSLEVHQISHLLACKVSGQRPCCERPGTLVIDA